MAARTVKISDLRIYPIKSCRGISLDSATLTRQGLKYDRRWMFVDATKGNKFVTIRQKANLTLINTAINEAEQTLEITFPSIAEAGLESTTISVPLNPTPEYLSANCETINVEIWEKETDAYTFTSEKIVSAVQNFFRSLDATQQSNNKNSNTTTTTTDIRLVMKGPTPRIATGNAAPEHLGRSESVNFPDVLPVLVASEVSLAELNSRLTEHGHEAITVERFRPNIILDSTDETKLTPWEEDEWRTIRIDIDNDDDKLDESKTTTTNTSTQKSSLLQSLSSYLPSNPFTTSALDTDPLTLDVSARCARCHVPNVDPGTAIAHPKQPWSELYAYRRIDEGIKYKPCFGMLCCPRSEGEVRVGMGVAITRVFSVEDKEAGGGHRYVVGF